MKLEIEINDEYLDQLERTVPVELWEDYISDEHEGLIAWIKDYCEGAVEELVEEFTDLDGEILAALKKENE